MNNRSDGLKAINNIEFATKKIEPILISNDTDFETAKNKFLKCFYIGIYQKEDRLSIVTDSGRYYLIDLNAVPIDAISDTLVFIKPKKIIFNFSDNELLTSADSKAFIDIQLAFKLLYGLEFQDINAVANHFKIVKNVYLIFSNLIKIAKEISIHLEKNRINKYYHIEMDTAMLLQVITKRGVSINAGLYDDLKNNISAKYNELMENKITIYGDDVDFEKKESIYIALSEGAKSLNDRIMKLSSSKLHNDYMLYNKYKWIQSLDIVKNKIHFKYNAYEDYQISGNLLIDVDFYGNDEVQIIKGEFNNLYYKILAELSMDNEFIAAASDDMLIEYMNDKMFEHGDEVNIYSDIILKSYLMGFIKPFDIQKNALEKLDTVLNVGDISKYNYHLSKEFPEFHSFILDFDGLDPSYDRFNKKIFNPSSSLDGYIKQIINLIFKNSLLEVERLTRDYSLVRKQKEKDELFISAVGPNIILISAIGDESKQIGIDILNRSMVNSYKYFIRNTRVSNYTKSIS